MQTLSIFVTPTKPTLPGSQRSPSYYRDSANIEANEHFDREAQALLLGSANDVNLENAMAGEHYENVTMYVDLANQAEADGDIKVAADVPSDRGRRRYALRSLQACAGQNHQ